MSLAAYRRDAIRAAQRLDAERNAWGARMRILRIRLGSHPIAWTVGGGFVGGLLAGWLPARVLAPLGRVIADAAALVLRTSLDPPSDPVGQPRASAADSVS